MQKKIIRSLTGAAYREHSTPLFAALQIIKLKDIYGQEVSKFMYLYNHNNLSEQLSHIFTYKINIHARNTRIIQHIRPIRSRTSLSLNSILLYNGLLILNRPTLYTNICFIPVSITPLVPINNTKMLFYVISNVISCYYYDCLKYYMRCNYTIIRRFVKKNVLST